MVSRFFDFRDASVRGDRRWEAAGRFTSLAPWLVLLLLVLSIVEIIIGCIFLTSNKDDSDISFERLIQPIFIPTLSFFNTVPSLHFHVLARNNPPIQAMIFSSCLSALFLASAIIFLPPCVSGDWDDHQSGGYEGVECPLGSRKQYWAAMVALHFASGLGYLAHFAMAWIVRLAVNKYEKDKREGRVVEVIDLEEEARQAAEARRRWAEIRNLVG